MPCNIFEEECSYLIREAKVHSNCCYITCTYYVHMQLCNCSTYCIPSLILHLTYSVTCIGFVWCHGSSVSTSTTRVSYLIGNRMVSAQKDGNTKDPNSHYDEVEMEPKGDFLTESGHSNPATEPQHEMCEMGVTSTDVTMEENPAYQSVDLAAAKP